MPTIYRAYFDLKAVEREQPYVFGFVRVSAQQELTQVANICAPFETDQQQLYLSPDLFYFGRETELGLNCRGDLPPDLKLQRFWSACQVPYVSATVERLKLSSERLEFLRKLMSWAEKDLAEIIGDGLGKFKFDASKRSSQNRLALALPEFESIAKEKGSFYSRIWSRDPRETPADIETSVQAVRTPLNIFPEWMQEYTTG